MSRSEKIEILATALSVAQGELIDAPKTRENPFHKSKYADLAGILQIIRPVFAIHGLSVVQKTGFKEGAVTIETILMHKSGQFISSELNMPISKSNAENPQRIGAAITYGRRYGLASMVGISQDDDDAQSIVAEPKPKVDARNELMSEIMGVMKNKRISPEAMTHKMNELFGKDSSSKLRKRELEELLIHLTNLE